MAINLLKKLLEPDPLKRYKANDALKHPWITRNIEDIIPQTLNEQININSHKNNMRDLMMINIFLNYLKKNQFDLNANGDDINSINNKKKPKEFLYKIQNKIMNKKLGIFKISKEYLKRCEYISKIEKIKSKEIKEKCLSVSNCDNNPNDKNNSNDDSNRNTNSKTDINSNTNSNTNSKNLNCNISGGNNSNINTNSSTNSNNNNSYNSIK
jgi:serine/threonine protein kinase